MTIKALFHVLGRVFHNTLCLSLFSSLLGVCNSSLKMAANKLHVDRGGFMVLLLF